jgi:hypothetical protein
MHHLTVPPTLLDRADEVIEYKRQCPLLELSGHSDRLNQCPLLGIITVRAPIARLMHFTNGKIDHSDGITDQKSLQRTSATKSAKSGHR